MNIFKRKKRYQDIDPDEIFLDSKNLPQFNQDQLEGRIERPLSGRVFFLVSLAFISIGFIVFGRIWYLQIASGESYRTKSENNRLKDDVVFANRGLILDRTGVPLAWNTIDKTVSDFPVREYATSSGLSTVLGYIKSPAKDKNGNYYRTEYEPQAGVEKTYNNTLTGVNGTQLTEVDALGNITSQSVVVPPKDGGNVTLSIDKGIEEQFYKSMVEYAGRAGYQGGSGVMMDVQTGEMIALANFPEYDSNVMADGRDVGKINEYLANKNNPFLNRAVAGLYTPGSIVKPFVAMGVLTEKVIDPAKQILSTGSISVPNPYDKTKFTIFKDWKALGWVDLRHAIAMSSDVYFYEVGGGFTTVGQPYQPGIGIANIEKYLRIFGFGDKTGIELSGEKTGIIPDPTWKLQNFENEPWRLGDTYNTAIGQYGVQVTPLQAVRAVATIANGGNVLVPTVLKIDNAKKTLYYPTGLDPAYFKIVTEGMRLTVTEGTAHVLNVPYVNISAKTGTAQVGISKSHVNSWTIGYFPTEHPRYAFAMVMEGGPAGNDVGASLVFRQVLDYMSIYKTGYFK